MAAVLVAGYTILGIVPRSPFSVEIAQLLINAIAFITGVSVIARALLAPHADQPRLMPFLAEHLPTYMFGPEGYPWWGLQGILCRKLRL